MLCAWPDAGRLAVIIVVDNFDSFVYNLARYVRLAGAKTKVVRNDEMSVRSLLSFRPDGVILSPGPKRPEDAGLCLELIAKLPSDLPFLGVCLGHQCLVQALGGETVRTHEPLHGEASCIEHVETGLFSGVPSPMKAGRYHSLIASLNGAADLKETAWTVSSRLVMAVQHSSRPWHGFQFHPESLLTPFGAKLIENFVRLCKAEARQ
ncbi:MAG: aminodeoxychorismate/anthranilate synthase component II [Pseudomonadota bacterium]